MLPTHHNPAGHPRQSHRLAFLSSWRFFIGAVTFLVLAICMMAVLAQALTSPPTETQSTPAASRPAETPTVTPPDSTATPQPTDAPSRTPTESTPPAAQQATATPAPTQQPANSAPPAAQTLIWPLSGNSTPDLVNSPFGPRWRVTQSRYDYHGGLDLPAPKNTPVHVVADGVVYSVGWQSAGGGLTVVIYHPALDIYTAYLHLNTALVAKDQTVMQGQVIGLSGNSGDTEFMHLHFEVRVPHNAYYGSTRNPMGYLPRPDAGAPTIEITDLQAIAPDAVDLSLRLTVPRDELDLKRIRVTVTDRATGVVVDDQMVDLDERLNTGSDSLDQNRIRLTPAPFGNSTAEYELGVEFYQLHARGAFTVTAEAVDLAGHTASVSATGDVATPTATATRPAR